MRRRMKRDDALRETYEDLNKSLEEKTEDKATSTAFILMFPALIIGGIAIYYAPIYMAAISIALAIYQFLMLKKFIVDFYKR